MSNENIETFMNKVEIINKDLSIYEDEEVGRLFYLNTVNLLTRVEYLELAKEEYMKAKFEKKINDLEYSIKEIERPVPKNTITKKDEDKYTIVNSKVSVRQVWNVVNGAGIYKSFTTKEEAFDLAESINKEVIEKLK